MSKKVDILLSLDVSTVSTGWSVFDKYKLVEFGTIKIKNTLDIHEKMVIFRDEIVKLLKKYKPTIILVEDVWMGRNAKTGKVLSKFCGIAEEATKRYRKSKPIIIGNTEVKGFLKCSDKKKVYDVIISLLEFDKGEYSYDKDNDITDSIAQALFYISEKLKINLRIEKPYGYLFDMRRVMNG